MNFMKNTFMRFSKLLLPIFYAVLFFNPGFSQSETHSSSLDNHMEWCHDARFRIFIH